VCEGERGEGGRGEMVSKGAGGRGGEAVGGGWGVRGGC